MRLLGFVLGTWVVAGGAIASLAACKNGEYDGSYLGGVDSGATADGSITSRAIQPDKTKTIATADGVLDVTFGAGTFATAATITITSAGEQTLDTGLIVPIFTIASDKPPTKFFQVSFHGSGNANNGGGDRTLVVAQQSGTAYKPLLIAGSPTVSGPSSTFWGLTKTFGTFSLAYVNNVQNSSFPETTTSCTGQCCPSTNNAQVSGSASGCVCPAGPNLDCYLAHCADLEGPAARCAAIAASNNIGSVSCRPLKDNCPTPGGCPGNICGNGTGGSVNNHNACCIANGGSQCSQNPCEVFSARCTKSSACPAGTQCCVFGNESYCAKDCPAAQRACGSDADCTDAGADAGTCQGGICPVGLCGHAPAGCQ